MGYPVNVNKYYTGFKLGNKVVFNVSWGGTNVWKVNFKLTEAEARGFVGQQWQFQNYSATFGEAVFRPLQPAVLDIKELEPLFVQAYKRVVGVK